MQFCHWLSYTIFSALGFYAAYLQYQHVAYRTTWYLRLELSLWITLHWWSSSLANSSFYLLAVFKKIWLLQVSTLPPHLSVDRSRQDKFNIIHTSTVVSITTRICDLAKLARLASTSTSFSVVPFENTNAETFFIVHDYVGKQKSWCLTRKYYYPSASNAHNKYWHIICSHHKATFICLYDALFACYDIYLNGGNTRYIL